MPILEVRRLSRSYPDGWTLQDVSFSMESGEVIAILGPSGCGKTTLLRLIAGLERPDTGQVLLNGVDITDTPPHRRDFGLMFQDYALFPHKDVFGNVAFGLRMRGLSRAQVAGRVAEALELVGLKGFEHRDVNRLSGGERQRVALARSLAPRPRLLMLDEPLGALDRTLRERLLEELSVILRQAGVTAIVVTHDQEEAFALADRVILMRAGRIVQMGTPEEVYARPASAWVARFLGLTNLLPARRAGPGVVETPIGIFRVEKDRLGWDGSIPMQLLIRPEMARPGHDGPNAIAGIITERTFRGEVYRLNVRLNGGVDMVFSFPASSDLPGPGEPITLTLPPESLLPLPLEEE
ncbi:MAG: ABC transporter ATP-binding protein [Anaerolineae bacterium]|nr:ABC transporter ATP-binding protein [Anaerolineae bacterium]